MSTSWGCTPNGIPARVPYMQNGACDMFSMPPASAICDSPKSSICAALTIDWMPEPHRRLTVSPPAVWGAPARRPTWRAP